MLQKKKKKKDHHRQPKRRCSRVPRHPESNLPVERGRIESLVQTNKHVVFVFKTRTFRERDCVARVSEMKKKPAQKSRRSSPKRGQRRTCVPTCDDVTTALEENVTVLFPFDSAGFPSAGSVGKYTFRRQQQGQRTIYKWQGWREAPRREREFVLKILARDTLIF